MITITVGNGGAGGAGGGSTGQTTTASIPSQTVSAAGGYGAASFTGGGIGHQGLGPGNLDYNGITYFGGTTENSFGATGNAPGGGGGGGNYVSFQYGGNGAKGAVWVRAYQ